MTADAHPLTRRGIANAAALATLSIGIAIIVCCSIVVYARPEGLWRTLALVWITAIGGAILIFRTAHRANEERVLRLVHVWALKLIAGIAILYFGWMPGLDPLSENYGYDPQRFYDQAQILQRAGYSTSAAAVMNYTGVLYVYAVVFGLFGANSFAPALVNALVSIWAILVVLRFLYALPQHRRNYWLAGLTIIIPEIIWFDDLVSRETLTTALLTVGILGCTSYLLPRDSVRRLHVTSFRVAILSLVLLGILRMSALAAAIAAIGVIYFAHRMTFKQRVVAVTVFVVISGALAVAPAIIRTLGGYKLDYLKELNPSFRAETALRDPNFVWSEGSIGRRLIGDTPAKLVLFTPIRMVVYLVLPLPNARVSFAELADGQWLPWQTALTAASAAIYIVLIPYVIALGIDVVRKRAPHGASILFVAFVVILTGIVTGNQILHERYRIMSIPLLVACSVLGTNATRSARRTGIALWLMTLGGAVAAYVVIRGLV